MKPRKRLPSVAELSADEPFVLDPEFAEVPVWISNTSYVDRSVASSRIGRMIERSERERRLNEN